MNTDTHTPAYERMTLICRGLGTDDVIRIAAAATSTGIRALEVTTNSPSAFETIARLSKEFGLLRLGVGTVRCADHVKAAADAGASFIVSPHLDEEIVTTTKAAGLLSVPGALTPTEIARAWAMGADLVKVFPVPQPAASYVAQIRAPLDDIPLAVSGGLTPEAAGRCLTAGAVSVLVGVNLIAGPAIAARAWTEVEQAIDHYCKVLSTTASMTDTTATDPSGSDRPVIGNPKSRPLDFATPTT